MLMLVIMVMILVVMRVAAAVQAAAVRMAAFIVVTVPGQAIFAALARIGDAQIAPAANP